MIKHRGLRHLALKVSDVDRAAKFYSSVFGMRVVWQPDADNAYLSSGCDNLALHRGSHGDADAQVLDHLGFIVPTIADVEASWKWAQEERLDIASAEASSRRLGVVLPSRSGWQRDPGPVRTHNQCATDFVARVNQN